MEATVPIFDYAILGSGFAASVLSMVLHRLGHRCVMIDRQSHPRFAIGESSTPIADQILLDLGKEFDLPILSTLARWSTAKEVPSWTVGCKRGFSYFFHQANADRPLKRCLLVPASPNLQEADSHWVRSEVDHVLALAAINLGVELREQTEIQAVERKRENWRLSCESSGGIEEIRACFLIDVSGSANLLDRLLKLERTELATTTKSGCVYGHFQKPCDWDSLWQTWQIDSSKFSFSPQLAAMHHVVDDGWMWHLGFDDDRISLGWVIDLNQSAVPGRTPHGDPLQEWWRQRLRKFPALLALYGDAKQVHPLTCVPKLQRSSSLSVGDAWLSLPSAVGFIDPLHSTGMAHSLTAILKIVTQLKCKGELDQPFLQRYSTALQREFWLLDQLVAMAYGSLSAPDKWEAATMMYFAGAIKHEEQRNNPQRNSLGEPIVHDFLMADDPLWLDRVVRGSRLLKKKKKPAEGWLAAVDDILGPYNNAGLADSQCEGIYHYTAAKK